MPEPRVAPAHADSRIRQNLDDPDPRSRRRGGLACAVITLAARRRQPVAPGMSSRAPAVLDGSSRRISARSNTSSSANVGCIISTVPLALNALVPLAQSTRCTDESRTSPLRDRPRRALHSRWNRVWGTAFRDPSDRGRCFPIPKSDRRGDAHAAEVTASNTRPICFIVATTSKSDAMRRSSSRCFTFGHPASRTARASASTPSPCPCPQPSRSARLPALIRRKAKLFLSAPIPILIEDWSRVYRAVKELKTSGVSDIDRYFDEHPQAVTRCARCMRSWRPTTPWCNSSTRNRRRISCSTRRSCCRPTGSATARCCARSTKIVRPARRAHAGDIQGPPRTDRMALLAAEARGRLPATAFLRVRRDRIEGEQRQAGSVARGSRARGPRVAVRGDVGVDTA